MKRGQIYLNIFKMSLNFYLKEALPLLHPQLRRDLQERQAARQAASLSIASSFFNSQKVSPLLTNQLIQNVLYQKFQQVFNESIKKSLHECLIVGCLQSNFHYFSDKQFVSLLAFTKSNSSKVKINHNLIFTPTQSMCQEQIFNKKILNCINFDNDVLLSQLIQSSSTDKQFKWLLLPRLKISLQLDFSVLQSLMKRVMSNATNKTIALKFILKVASVFKKQEMKEELLYVLERVEESRDPKIKYVVGRLSGQLSRRNSPLLKRILSYFQRIFFSIYSNSTVVHVRTLNYFIAFVCKKISALQSDQDDLPGDLVDVQEKQKEKDKKLSKEDDKDQEQEDEEDDYSQEHITNLDAFVMQFVALLKKNLNSLLLIKQENNIIYWVTKIDSLFADRILDDIVLCIQNQLCHNQWAIDKILQVCQGVKTQSIYRRSIEIVLGLLNFASKPSLSAVRMLGWVVPRSKQFLMKQLKTTYFQGMKRLVNCLNLMVPQLEKKISQNDLLNTFGLLKDFSQSQKNEMFELVSQLQDSTCFYHVLRFIYTPKVQAIFKTDPQEKTVNPKVASKLPFLSHYLSTDHCLQLCEKLQEAGPVSAILTNHFFPVCKTHELKQVEGKWSISYQNPLQHPLQQFEQVLFQNQIRQLQKLIYLQKTQGFTLLQAVQADPLKICPKKVRKQIEKRLAYISFYVNELAILTIYNQKLQTTYDKLVVLTKNILNFFFQKGYMFDEDIFQILLFTISGVCGVFDNPQIKQIYDELKSRKSRKDRDIDAPFLHFIINKLNRIHLLDRIDLKQKPKLDAVFELLLEYCCINSLKSAKIGKPLQRFMDCLAKRGEWNIEKSTERYCQVSSWIAKLRESESSSKVKNKIDLLLCLFNSNAKVSLLCQKDISIQYFRSLKNQLTEFQKLDSVLQFQSVKLIQSVAKNMIEVLIFQFKRHSKFIDPNRFIANFEGMLDSCKSLLSPQTLQLIPKASQDFKGSSLTFKDQLIKLNQELSKEIMQCKFWKGNIIRFVMLFILHSFMLKEQQTQLTAIYFKKLQGDNFMEKKFIVQSLDFILKKNRMKSLVSQPYKFRVAVSQQNFIRTGCIDLCLFPADSQLITYSSKYALHMNIMTHSRQTSLPILDQKWLCNLLQFLKQQADKYSDMLIFLMYFFGNVFFQGRSMFTKNANNKGNFSSTQTQALFDQLFRVYDNQVLLTKGFDLVKGWLKDMQTNNQCRVVVQAYLSAMIRHYRRTGSFNKELQQKISQLLLQALPYIKISSLKLNYQQRNQLLLRPSNFLTDLLRRLISASQGITKSRLCRVLINLTAKEQLALSASQILQNSQDVNLVAQSAMPVVNQIMEANQPFDLQRLKKLGLLEGQSKFFSRQGFYFYKTLSTNSQEFLKRMGQMWRGGGQERLVCVGFAKSLLEKLKETRKGRNFDLILPFYELYLTFQELHFKETNFNLIFSDFSPSALRLLLALFDKLTLQSTKSFLERMVGKLRLVSKQVGRSGHSDLKVQLLKIVHRLALNENCYYDCLNLLVQFMRQASLQQSQISSLPQDHIVFYRSAKVIYSIAWIEDISIEVDLVIAALTPQRLKQWAKLASSFMRSSVLPWEKFAVRDKIRSANKTHHYHA